VKDRLAQLIQALNGVRLVLFDTNAFIYFLKEIEPWEALVRAILERGDRELLRVVVPSIVQMELLVHTFRYSDEMERRKIDVLLGGTHFIDVQPAGVEVIRTASEIRGVYRTNIADGLVMGSAFVSQSDAVIGNDKGFKILNQSGGLGLQTRPGVWAPRYIHLDDFVG
jgi:predicted nucleic acid-binding protein